MDKRCLQKITAFIHPTNMKYGLPYWMTDVWCRLQHTMRKTNELHLTTGTPLPAKEADIEKGVIKESCSKKGEIQELMITFYLTFFNICFMNEPYFTGTNNSDNYSHKSQAQTSSKTILTNFWFLLWNVLTHPYQTILHAKPSKNVLDNNSGSFNLEISFSNQQIHTVEPKSFALCDIYFYRAIISHVLGNESTSFAMLCHKIPKKLSTIRGKLMRGQNDDHTVQCIW